MASDREQEEEYHLFLRGPYFYRSADPIIGSDSQRDGAGVGRSLFIDIFRFDSPAHLCGSVRQVIDPLHRHQR